MLIGKVTSNVSQSSHSKLWIRYISLGETNDVLWHHSLTSKKDLLQNEFCILLKQTIAGFCF